MGAAVAGNLIRNNVPVVLHDINGDANVPDAVRESIKGATWVGTAKEAAEAADVRTAKVRLLRQKAREQRGGAV